MIFVFCEHGELGKYLRKPIVRRRHVQFVFDVQEILRITEKWKKKKSSSTRVYTLPSAGIFVETTPNRTYFQKQFVRERDSYDDGGQAHLGRVHDVLLRHPEVSHHGRIVRRVDFEQPVVQHHGLFGVLVVIVLVDVVRSGYGRVHQFYADLKNHTLSLQKTAGWPLFRRRRFFFLFFITLRGFSFLVFHYSDTVSFLNSVATEKSWYYVDKYRIRKISNYPRRKSYSTRFSTFFFYFLRKSEIDQSRGKNIIKFPAVTLPEKFFC